MFKNEIVTFVFCHSVDVPTLSCRPLLLGRTNRRIHSSHQSDHKVHDLGESRYHLYLIKNQLSQTEASVSSSLCTVLHRSAGSSLCFWGLSCSDGGGGSLHKPGLLWPPADLPLYNAQLTQLHPLLWSVQQKPTSQFYPFITSNKEVFVTCAATILFPLFPPVLVVVNHYMAFQYFAQEYYPFSEVSDSKDSVCWLPCSLFLSLTLRWEWLQCH